MRFLLDEGLPLRITAYLREHGHDIVTVGRDYPFALPDRQILEIARNELRIVLTNDTDFGDLVFREHLPHAGVILFRLGYVSLPDRIARLQQVLVNHADQLDRFIVVTARNIRVR